MTTKESFLKLQSLKETKFKNEAALSIEILQSKYKVPYEKLCVDLKEAEKELRLKYIESIRILNEFAAETVYIKFGKNDGWEELQEIAHKFLDEGKNEPVLRCLLVGFLNALDEMNKERE